VTHALSGDDLAEPAAAEVDRWKDLAVIVHGRLE
jgi:hypothetical protein